MSIFLAIALNAHKLLGLFTKPGKSIGIPWEFNLPELIYQAIFQLLFSFVFGYLNLWLYDKYKNDWSKWLKLAGINLLLFAFFFGIGNRSQEFFFHNVTNFKLFRIGYFVRFLISAGLMLILDKILLMYRNQHLKDLENERLKTAYSSAQLENLKAQINPHFLFNALSNLSALIREKPTKAQEYVTHLSRVFRYALANRNEQLVPLNKELELLHSHIALLEMRFEEALDIQINIETDLHKNIPHMSLQPLLENAIKHNTVSLQNPLTISITKKGDLLIFKNNLNPQKVKEISTGIGLYNLNERYKLLMEKEIEIIKTETEFIIKLPLI